MSEIRSQATPADGSLETEHYQLFNLIENTISAVIESAGPEDEYWEAASAVLKAGWSRPRTVNSAAELDALPVNSVVVDASDAPRTKRYGDSHMGAGWTNAGRSPLSSRELADGRPMRVLFTPGDA